jgi:DNA-binding NarL/FixJ family response regulator
MNPTLNCLVVDDHPMLIDGYISVISNFADKYNCNFIKATDCKSAYKAIEENYNLNNNIHIAIFDISLTAYKEKKIFCGGDLALHFKKRYKNSKIIIVSQHNQGIILKTIQDKVHPNGLLNKRDIDYKNFKTIFYMILNNENYVSKTISNSLYNLNRNIFDFDAIDYEIIALLDKGIKTKDLPNHLSISLSAIEKRKSKIKFSILNSSGKDQELIAKIKDLNLI